MTTAAKVYLSSTIGLGLVLAALGLSQWKSRDLPAYTAYLLLTILVSTFKVKLPGLDGTYSLSFIFLLVSVVEFNLAQVVVLACAAATVQSLWRRKNRPTAVQAAFNIACLVITVTTCYGVNQLAMQALGSRLICLLLVTVVYFLVNTCMVAGIMGLVSDERILTVWRQWFLWSFPYYVVGAGIAWAVSMSGPHRFTGILSAALPFLYLMYWYYRQLLARAAEAR